MASTELNRTNLQKNHSCLSTVVYGDFKKLGVRKWRVESVRYCDELVDFTLIEVEED